MNREKRGGESAYCDPLLVGRRDGDRGGWRVDRVLDECAELRAGVEVCEIESGAFDDAEAAREFVE